MTPLKTLLVDDEESALEGLSLRLKHFSDIDIIGQASSVDEAIALSQHQMPDLVFLDIEMPGKSGFELLTQFQPETYPAIIFITAYHQHAIKAFDVRALDYLLKPVKQSRLEEAVVRARQTISSKQHMLDSGRMLAMSNGESAEIETYSVGHDKLVIQDGAGPVTLVPFEDVFWIDAAGDYMCVHTEADTFVMRERMKNLVNIVPSYFQRIHKSTMVNIRYIEQLEPLRNSEYHVHLFNNKILKASRTFSRALKDRIIVK
ncbi:response regulator transcription factor [Salinimonas sp. HHU 13199]|uniref:Response regulator transcription factor n=1 Tax=Salinimonas profundi TaxID=2729140 RepID=A0ABR8LJH3_9ALTE|nr:LytTR family DNA-binding domain-containing protein [Salinimonas profundi]MBD3585907.1 response regulator transcription factor [Salinimonas profundi]